MHIELFKGLTLELFCPKNYPVESSSLFGLTVVWAENRLRLQCVFSKMMNPHIAFFAQSGSSQTRPVIITIILYSHIPVIVFQ